jgi:hypothetical protein
VRVLVPLVGITAPTLVPLLDVLLDPLLDALLNPQQHDQVDPLLDELELTISLASTYTQTQSDEATDTDTLDENVEPLIYVTYTKIHPLTGRVYAGRTSGRGVAEDLVAERDRNHHRNAEGYGIANIDVYATANLPYSLRHIDPAYLAIRGREQQLIDSYGGSWSDVGMANTKSGNKIRGIAKYNPLGRLAHATANRYFGQIAPYTGF